MPAASIVLPVMETLSELTGPRLLVLVGLPASGKSTFARWHLADTHVVVSKDLMRSARRKERRQVALLTEHLSAGRRVVVDNTNPAVTDRRRLIDQAREHDAGVAGLWFPTTVNQALARNAERTGREAVPPVAIHSIAKRFVPPRPEEGFDVLQVAAVQPGGGFGVRPWRPEDAERAPEHHGRVHLQETAEAQDT